MGWTILRAIPRREWPGTANIYIACTWLRRGLWKGVFYLNDDPVPGITSYLASNKWAQEGLHPLYTNLNMASTGSKVYGEGFVLRPRQAIDLLNINPKNREVLFPYLNGEDLNNRFDQSPSRWVINFHNWSIEQAGTYLDCLNILREKVKPERDKIASNSKLHEYWWLYERARPELYEKIRKMERVLAIAFTSRTCAFTFVPTDIVFSNAVVILIFDSMSSFALLQSSFHVEWAFTYGSEMKSDLRYILSQCFNTFPFPRDVNVLDSIGKLYYNHRQSIMLARQEGLTKTYNRFHDQHEKALDIVRLRELHKEMDEAVARAYGWEDLKLEHGFHETKQGMRYTISEVARREVLDRLLLLNHQRHEEEVQAGLFGQSERKGGKGRNNGKKHSRNDERKDDLQRVLFSE
jgi:hypothetical protein